MVFVLLSGVPEGGFQETSYQVTPTLLVLFRILYYFYVIAYGTVFLVRKLNGRHKGQLFAMKELKKSKIIGKRKLVDHTRTERRVLAAIRKLPFLANLQWSFQSDEKLYFIMGKMNFN